MKPESGNRGSHAGAKRCAGVKRSKKGGVATLCHAWQCSRFVPDGPIPPAVFPGCEPPCRALQASSARQKQDGHVCRRLDCQPGMCSMAKLQLGSAGQPCSKEQTGFSCPRLLTDFPHQSLRVLLEQRLQASEPPLGFCVGVPWRFSDTSDGGAACRMRLAGEETGVNYNLRTPPPPTNNHNNVTAADVFTVLLLNTLFSRCLTKDAIPIQIESSGEQEQQGSRGYHLPSPDETAASGCGPHPTSCSFDDSSSNMKWYYRTS